MQPITMGSCYMDKGEDIKYVRDQLVRMAKMKPVQYFFDIICRPDQIDDATVLLREFYNLTSELIPSLKRDAIFVGITCNDLIRPATMSLAMIQNISGMPANFMDVNPTRKGRDE